MAKRSERMSNVELAVGFGLLIAVVVGVRLAVVWLGSSSGPTRLAVSIGLVVVFVLIPLAYGLRGLLRDDGEDPGG